MLLAGGITFAFCLICCGLFDMITLPKYVFEGVKIIVITVACLGIYTGLNLVFRMDYAKELVNRLKR